MVKTLNGEDAIIERHGQAIAAVISVKHFDEFQRVRNAPIADALILARELSDTGDRTDLNDAISAFGFAGPSSKPTLPPAADDIAVMCHRRPAVTHG